MPSNIDLMKSFSYCYITETMNILNDLVLRDIEKVVEELRNVTGRLFIMGVGGSAGTASHAVNDFRKICGIQAFCPTDNASELTARINDEGWSAAFMNWLQGSKIDHRDALLILSVGGGDEIKAVSVPLCNAIMEAKRKGAVVLGIVGRDGGFTAKKADACVVIPPKYADHITPHTEGIASVILHLIVSHPSLKVHGTKWETLQKEIESGRTDRT